MKWKLMIAAFAFCAGVASTPAQLGAVKVKVQVPFTFGVANRTMPAGEYVLWSDRTEVLLRDSDGEIVAMLATNRVVRGGSNSGQVVFHCYEGKCFLSQLWMPDAEQGREVLESKAERELAKQKEPQMFALQGSSKSQRPGN
ncbi:MAG TPA: hypothetical protein VL128_12015 [Candidatus Eisenbacteria bacterium]|nr:hypothetical protein [Candidatus Eisenbacteria bacterium]